MYITCTVLCNKKLKIIVQIMFKTQAHIILNSTLNVSGVTMSRLFGNLPPRTLCGLQTWP